MAAARMLRSARRRAGKTQRELSSATGISQATIARIETGQSDPRVGTLLTLLRACGYEVETMALLGQGVDRHAIRRNLKMTPTQRLELGVRAAAAIAPFRGILRADRQAATSVGDGES